MRLVGSETCGQHEKWGIGLGQYTTIDRAPKQIHDCCILALYLAHTLGLFPLLVLYWPFFTCSAQGIESTAEKQGKYIGNHRQDVISAAIIATATTSITTITVFATHSITKVC